MRLNLEGARSRQVKHFGAKYGSVRLTLTGNLTLPSDGPSIYVLDPGAANRDVFLPPVPIDGGLVMDFANISASKVINIKTAGGLAIATIAPAGGAHLFCDTVDWKFIQQPQLAGSLAGLLEEPTQISGATFTFGTETNVAIVRVAPASTAINLPTVVGRAGAPVRIIDWSSSVTAHTITLTPVGAETIMKNATMQLFSNAASLASIALWPSASLNGWYIAP